VNEERRFSGWPRLVSTRISTICLRGWPSEIVVFNAEGKPKEMPLVMVCGVADARCVRLGRSHRYSRPCNTPGTSEHFSSFFFFPSAQECQVGELFVKDRC